MEKTLITGAEGFIGNYLASVFPEAKSIGHRDCDLTNWKEVEKFDWEGKTIINCAYVGQYGQDKPGYLEQNILLAANLRRRWPKTKIISFGSGAMYDRSKPVSKAGEYGKAVYPKDLYGLAKRLVVDLSDITLIMFGVFGKIRFPKSVLEHIKKNEPVDIYQEMLFSWVNLSDLPGVIKWAINNGQGRYNLCGYDMLLSSMADYLGAKTINYRQDGIGFEYTGKSNSLINLTSYPCF